jgi:Tfp pilus assembly protein PilF
MTRWTYTIGFFLTGLVLAQRGFGQANAKQAAEFAAHMQKATEDLRAKRPDLAIPELKAATELDPDSVEAQANLGVLLFFQGKPADAVPHLRTAVKLQPSLAKIQGILGLAEVRTSDLSQGRSDLEAAFPQIQDIPFKVQVGLELVSLYTEAGELESTPAILVQLQKAAPEDPEVLYASYRAYADLSSKAMLSLSLAAADSAQMHQLLAHEAIRQGNTNVAMRQMEKAVSINPALPGIHFELAELMYTSSDQQAKRDAEGEYRKALAQNPQDEKSLLRLAEIETRNGRADAALEDYRKAASLQPGDSEPMLGLAKILIERNQSDKALPWLESAVKADPSNAVAHYRLGTEYRKLGRMDDAKREVETYKNLREAKEKMRAVYKDLLVQPQQIRTDLPDEK